MQRRTAGGIALIVIGIFGLVVLSALSGGGSPGGWGWRGGPMPAGYGGHHMGGPWGMRGPRGGSGTGSQIPPVAGARTVDIVATDFSFKPAEVSIRAGETVNVRLVNQGVTVHDLVVPSQGIWLIAPAGQSVTSGLKFDQTGTCEFLCSVPGHREAGMIGRIIVTT
jgi:plastocyanin